MSNDTDTPPPSSKDTPPPADDAADSGQASGRRGRAASEGVKTSRSGGSAAKAAPSDGKLPPLDERRLRYEDLAPHGKTLDADELIEMTRDGRAVVRANAALGLAAAGHPAPPLVTLLRDSDAGVAQAAADAVSRLGLAIRPLIPAIVEALDSAQPEVSERVIAALGDVVGSGDDELIASLDVPYELAMRTIVPMCARLGRRGISFLIQAARHERSRIRVNAVGGLAQLGKTDKDTTMAFLSNLEVTDPSPDVRSAAKQAMLAVVAWEKVPVVDRLPKNIPEFEERRLAVSELREHAGAIDVDQMTEALHDGRNHVRINAARSLAVKGEEAGRAAGPLGLLLLDSHVPVRREAARSLAKLGGHAIAAADDLVGALGDADPEVADAASDTLAGLGGRVTDALVRGLDAGSETHGRRVTALIGRLPHAADILAEAMRSPAVNVQVNAALGLGALGRDRVGAGLQRLLDARTGGDARTRDAVRRALDVIEVHEERLRAVPIDGFEDTPLAAADLEKQKAAIDGIGAAGLIGWLQDGRDVVRSNAAVALALLGPAAATAATALGIALRDDSPRVRLAAAHALDRIGDGSVDAADDLVAALGDSDDRVAEAVAVVLRARKGKVIGALVRGLETDRSVHGRRIVELIHSFDDASEILCEAFEGPAVNVQVNAAIGLGMLGKKRVGRGRRLLEDARTGGWEQTRKAVRRALDMLDGPPPAGPRGIEIDGFDTRILPPDAFGDPARLKVDVLIAHLTDGRAAVRANAATALGALGAAAAVAVRPLGVLLRDDDKRVRIAAAAALDRLGDDAVREIAEFLVGALGSDEEVARTCSHVLGARKARVLGALLAGLTTDDETHATRILELINALPDAPEILLEAFEGPVENVQVNAALGLGMLGPDRAGKAGRRALEGARTGGFRRTREAVFRALGMLERR